MNPLVKIWYGACAFGLVRNSIVATMIPMKENELYTSRAGTILFTSFVTPIYLPMLLMSDVANIERKLRGMKPEYQVPLVN